MIRRTLAEVARLDDIRLETLIRDAIEEAQRRPGMRPGLTQLLAGVLEEIKAERLVRLDLAPEEICRLAAVNVGPEFLLAPSGARRAPGAATNGPGAMEGPSLVAGAGAPWAPEAPSKSFS